MKYITIATRTCHVFCHLLSSFQSQESRCNRRNLLHREDPITSSQCLRCGAYLSFCLGPPNYLRCWGVWLNAPVYDWLPPDYPVHVGYTRADL